MPYTIIFLESNGGKIMKPSVNKKFILADSFLFGNLLQTSSEIYVFEISVFDNDSRKKPITCEVYSSHRGSENYNYYFRGGGK